MLICLTSSLFVDPDRIVSLRKEHRDYMNGSDNFLIVEMADGKTHRLQHGYGIDVFDLEKKILDYQREAGPEARDSRTE